MDALWRRLVEVKSLFLEGGGHVDVTLAADREIERLARQLRASQGRAAIREVDLNVKINRVMAETIDLRAELARS